MLCKYCAKRSLKILPEASARWQTARQMEKHCGAPGPHFLPRKLSSKSWLLHRLLLCVCVVPQKVLALLRNNVWGNVLTIRNITSTIFYLNFLGGNEGRLENYCIYYGVFITLTTYYFCFNKVYRMERLLRIKSRFFTEKKNLFSH